MIVGWLFLYFYWYGLGSVTLFGGCGALMENELMLHTKECTRAWKEWRVIDRKYKEGQLAWERSFTALRKAQKNCTCQKKGSNESTTL
jgi:hypothetical protein